MPALAKFRTHEEAEAATLEYYRRLTPEQRLEILFELLRQAQPEDDAATEGMVRVCRVLKLERG